MKTLAERVEQLSPAKRALLDKLLKQEQSATLELRRIPRRQSAGPAPLSFAQQRLWFLDQLEPGNPFYNVSAAVRIEGPLDAATLRRCIDEIVRRHEILRTHFAAHNGRPLQHVASASTWTLREINLRDQPADERETETRRLAVEEAQRPFDLASDPLLRTTLLQLDDEQHVLLLVMHHIVCDGWSMAVLRQEIAALYEAYASGKASPLDDLELQYADFAAWQHDWIEGDALAKQLDYWRDQLGDDPPPVQLPTDRPRPAVQTYRGNHLRRRLPTELSAALEAFARDEQVTLFMLLLAAFQTLLARWSGQEDITIGSPIASRRPAELERLIGFFANTLVLRSDLSGDPSFRALLARVRQTTLDAYAHQDLPFGKLVEELKPQRDLSRAPLFQVMFVLQNIPLAARDVAGLRVHDVDLGLGESSAFDLTLNVEQQPDGLQLLMEYNTDLFDRETIERVTESLEILLAGIVADPQQPISRLPILSEAERQRLLVEWNDTQRAFPHDRCLHNLFEAQVARTPNAVAAVMDNVELTYAELDAQANQLARHLRDLGAGPETRVGILLDRSPQMLVALLGILKAGAAYVPVDIANPPSRLAYLCQDAGLALVVTQADLKGALPAESIQAVALDADRAAIEQHSPETLASNATPDRLAYVVYTSGSTGEPKGVEVAHRSVVNHAVQLAERYGLVEGDRVLQYLSLSFDASGEEIYPALLSGATLVVHPAPAELSGEDTLEFSRRQGINVLHIPPPLWHQVVDLLRAEGPSLAYHLKTFMTGGDALAPEKLQQWRQLVGDRVKFLYAYGVTEATITSTLYEVPPQTADAPGGRVPVGRPIANHRVYVLDRHGQPLPIGVYGELCIGGVGVARGYLNRPELTAEKFRPDPFCSQPGARIYRTGDLARFLPDGNLEFVGRMDHQVKVRGFRIEPGEIEAALTAHVGVRETLVMVREDQPGHKRLVAYVVANPDAEISVGELRGFLKRKLPEHMVPSLFVALDVLPRTATGKIDRHALPVPESARPELEQDYVAPRDPVEEQLARVWSDVLQIERVGVYDNFFELGGDSILSIQMIARARAAGLVLTPKQLFQHQTIADLAEVAGTGPAIEAEQGPVTGPVPLMPIQRQFLAGDPPDPEHFNQAVLLQVQPGLKPEAIRQALAALIEHHDALRMRFRREGSDWCQTGTPPDESNPLEVTDLSSLPAAEQTTAIERTAGELQAGLNLAEGPLIRCAYLKLGDRAAGRLLIVIHHLVVDGVSWRILLEDLGLACMMLRREEAIALPPKTTSFQRWAERLTEYAQTDAVRDELSAWRTIADADRRPLPRDRDDGENTVASARTVRRALEPDETRALLQEVPQAYRTRMNDALLAALAQAMTRSTGGKELLVDLEGHGREDLFDDADVSRTVGWFTTMFPVRLRLSQAGEPGQSLKEIKEQLRRVPHGGIGFGLLRWLAEDADAAAQLDQLPQAEMSFNYLGQFDQLADEGSMFAAAEEATGPAQSPRATRPHVLDVIARVQGGRLDVSWIYSEALHRRATIERVADDFMVALRALIQHCLLPDAGGFTASDFPLANVDEDELSALSDALEGIDDGADDAS